MISEYLSNITKAYNAGNATEHTHRPALKDLIESLATGVVATNEPRRACCNPRSDTITLPPQTAFQSPEEYYSTAFHGLTHSTMHENRLNRKVSSHVHSWGDEAYSKEELVAECGASFLCGHCGIENTTIENNAAYLAGWLKALKNDRTLLIHSAAQAQKASDYILGKGGDEDLTEEISV